MKINKIEERLLADHENNVDYVFEKNFFIKVIAITSLADAKYIFISDILNQN